MFLAYLVLLRGATATLGGRQVTSGLPSGANLTLIADGFTWVENLIFDDFGNLWVTDLFDGIVYRITRDPSTHVATRTVWLTGFHKCLGLARGPGTTIFFVGIYADSNCTLSSFDANVPNVSKIVAYTGTSDGNGLVYDAATDTLYTTSEGGFIPFFGRVFVVPHVSSYSAPPNALDYQVGLNDCDGLFLDLATNLLYMSEVVTGTVYVYNTTQSPTGKDGATPVRQFHAPNMSTLDDMCIVHGMPWGLKIADAVVAADWLLGNVVAFDVSGAAPGVILAKGFANPTSVRRPLKGSVWDNSGRSLYVTEGGCQGAAGCGVWELTPAL